MSPSEPSLDDLVDYALVHLARNEHPKLVRLRIARHQPFSGISEDQIDLAMLKATKAHSNGRKSLTGKEDH